MADIRLSRPKKQKKEPQDQVEMTGVSLSAPQSKRNVAAQPIEPAQAQGVLSTLGGGAMHALHTVGSLTSWPERVIAGGINGAMGLEGGYGRMKLLDGTGDIMPSKVLENLGLHPKNDPKHWEMSDFTRFGIDAGLDPLTYTGAGALTKSGQLATKGGTAARGMLNQIAKGERSLVSLHNPLTGSTLAHAGTGQGVADAIRAAGTKTGAFRLAKAVNESKFGRNFKAMSMPSLQGKLHNILQKHMPNSWMARRSAQRMIDRDIYAIATKLKNDNLLGAEHSSIFRDILEGVDVSHNQLVTPAHYEHAATMKQINNQILDRDLRLGVKTGHLRDDDVEHFVRRMSSGIDDGAHHGFEMAGNKTHGRDDVFKQLGGTNSIERMLKDPEIDSAIWASSHLPKQDQIDLTSEMLRERHGRHFYDDLTRTHSIKGQFMENGADRFEEIAKKMVGSPEIRKEGLFGNHPLYDLHAAASSGNNRAHAADVLFKSIADDMHHGTHGVNVHSFLDNAGFHSPVAAEHIAKAIGMSVDDVLKMNITDDLAHELKSFTPGYQSPPATKNMWDIAKSLSTIWKSSVLAHPASRVRDAAGGVFQNMLGGMNLLTPSGRQAWADARNIAHKTKLKGDYSNLPEVADLMRRHKLDHDDAVKIILATEAPRSSGFLADTAPGQVATGIDDIIAAIPGHEKGGIRSNLARATKSLWYGELDRGGFPRATGRGFNPANVRGALDRVISGTPREATGFGPAAASNVIAGGTDEFNRHAGILSGMARGYNPSVAGAATRAAQVDYDPETFTAQEQKLKQLMPFYGFHSRMLAHTANELASHPGGALAQIVKGTDRASSNDQSLPDWILDSTSIPVKERPDGTKEVITGLGLMHEPAVKMLGQAVGGDFGGLGYNLFSQLNPLIRTPFEKTTGQQFFKDGQPISQADPTIGRTLSNFGVGLGLRDKNAGPVKYPGSSLAETALELSPFSRAATTLRQLTDTRKELAPKLATALTGVKVTDVSPKQQHFTILKRAEDLAKANGAKSRSDVYFKKSELEALKETDPVQYEKQKAMQTFLNQLKAKSKAGSGTSKTPKARKTKSAGKIKMTKVRTSVKSSRSGSKSKKSKPKSIRLEKAR